MKAFNFGTTALLLLAFFFISCAGAVSERPSSTTSTEQQTDDAEQEAETPAEVTVTLFLMSKCPYCADALEVLIPIAQALEDRFELRTEYVGTVREGELFSPHGPDELLGDLVEICVHEHATYQNWLGFLACYSRNWQEIPEGFEECTELNDINERAVRACFEGLQGQELLEASFNRSYENNVDSTPTMFIGDITIPGMIGATTMAQVICNQFGEPLPAFCELVDPLQRVPITVLTDERCEHEACDISERMRELNSVVWGADIHRLTYQSKAGRALFESRSLKRLPTVIIGSELEDDPQGYKALGHLRRSGDDYIRTFGRFDPKLGRWVERPVLDAKVLFDRICDLEECETESAEKALAEVWPTVKISRLDYRDPEGKALFSKIGSALGPDSEVTLPLFLLSKELADDEDFLSNLSDKLQPVDDSYLFVMGRWDPTVEICDNEVDDDGDGQVDCRDSDCDSNWGCRAEKARHLELFAMSQCPFATAAMRSMEKVIDHFKGRRKSINFRINYIGKVIENGELWAMHGPDEVAEDLRGICVQHFYKRNYAFMDYIACRARDYSFDDWEQCVPSGLKARKIRNCAEGPLGKKLLTASYKRSESLGVSGSPSWMLNNKYPMNARSPQAIVEAYCERNSLPECSQDVESGDLESTPDSGDCQ